jgi:hypothetical protein
LKNISNGRGLWLFVRINVNVVFVAAEFANPKLTILFNSNYTEHV